MSSTRKSTINTLTKLFSIATYLFITIALLSTWSYAENATSDECLKYTPKTETINGKLLYKTIVDNSLNKPIPKKYVIIKLNKEICISPINKQDEINETFYNIDQIQIAYSKKFRESILNNINKNVIVSGYLFSAHTAHHLEKVLIQIISIETITNL